MTKYTKAMTHDAAVDSKMKYLSKDHNFILIAHNKKKITMLHNLKNYCGTILQPTHKVAAWFGMGPKAQVVALDDRAAIATQSKRTQSLADITTTANIGTNSLCALWAPTCGNINFNGIIMLTPVPSLCNAILEAMTSCPFDIIQVALATHRRFVQEHQNTNSFNAGNIKAHHNLFIMWCMMVGQELISETCFFILLDDHELKRHKWIAHREHILPTLNAASASQVNPAKTVDVLRQLGASMAHSSKAAEAQNATQCKQLDYLKEKDKKKKDKAEKWHGLSWRLVLNAASTDGQLPATEISKSYQDIINSEMAVMADKELHSQMVALGHHDAGFPMGQLQASTTATFCGTEKINQGKNNPLL
jgi:hypothetical protein